MKLIGVSGTLAGNKTSQAVYDCLESAMLKDSSIETELIDLKDYDIEFSHGWPTAYYNDDTIKVVQKILAADALVFGTPIYQASISGVLKNLFDLFEANAFKHKVTGIIATGGSEKHFLVPEFQLKPILTYLKGVVPSTYVFIHNDFFDIETDDIIDQGISNRIDNLASEILYLQKGISSRGQ